MTNDTGSFEMHIHLQNLSRAFPWVLALLLGSCSSFTARRFAVYTVETVPAGGSVRIDNRRYRADGCDPIPLSHRVRYERNPGNARFSAYQAPLTGGILGGPLGLFLTISSPPLGLTTLAIGTGVAVVPAFIDHQVSRVRWKKEHSPVPVTLTLEHPSFPTRSVRFTVVGYPTRDEARKKPQALRYTFRDDNTFTLFKSMKSGGIRKLVIVPVMEPFEEFEQGLISFQKGFFLLMEKDTEVDARVYVLPPGPGGPEMTPQGRRWKSSAGLLPGIPEKDPIRRIRVVEVRTGQVLFDALISHREYSSAMKTQYFRGDSWLSDKIR